MLECLPAEKANRFSELGLDTRLVDSLDYSEPTPIQREAIPPQLVGRDLVGIAGTGTGKTAAFALPLLQRIAALDERGHVAALILVPTRELATQVAKAVGIYGKPLGVRTVAVYGGAGFHDQVRDLRRADVVVATPGRALDHVRRGTLNLADVSAVVLDEADEMLDMGFADDLDAILSATPSDRQTVLFSATMPPRTAALGRRHLSDPVRVSVAAAPRVSGEEPLVRQTAYIVRRDQRAAALLRVLDYEVPAATIVFCRTRNEVDGLTDELAARGHKPAALHGGLSQDQRERVMQQFRSGATTVLVATDVAARGLDIGHLSHVVNFGMPESSEAYVHRVGRVGRAGRGGVAITVAEPRDRWMIEAVARIVGHVEYARVPTPTELRVKRGERTRATLREVIVAGGLADATAVVAPLAAEFGAAAVAAAALILLERTRPTADERDIPAADGPPRGRRPAIRR